MWQEPNHSIARTFQRPLRALWPAARVERWAPQFAPTQQPKNITMHRICSLLATLVSIVLTGCAHPIQIAPDLARIERASAAEPRLAAKVAFYIPPEATAAEITTAGGGGDNVRYYPYRDMEPGFQKMLSNVFTSVVKLSSMSDRAALARDDIAYVVVPTLITSSGGSGLFTWPPTNFTLDLTSQVRSADGKLIASPRVVGTGTAETGERLAEHGIAGKRAMEDALRKMEKALVEVNLGGAAKPPLASPGSSIGERLARLKELKDSGAITAQEYEAKRKEILEAL